MYLAIHLPIDLPTYIPIHPSTHTYLYLPTYLSTYLPVYLPTFLPIYLSIYLRTVNMGTLHTMHILCSFYVADELFPSSKKTENLQSLFVRAVRGSYAKPAALPSTHPASLLASALIKMQQVSAARAR